jgi:hypothetical protein
VAFGAPPRTQNHPLPAPQKMGLLPEAKPLWRVYRHEHTDQGAFR